MSFFRSSCKKYINLLYGSFHANVNLKNGKKRNKIILQQIIVSVWYVFKLLFVNMNDGSVKMFN